VAIEFDRLRLLWPDHLGLARGKYLTPEKAGDWETAEYLPFL
jgi:hypothetical protein